MLRKIENVLNSNDELLLGNNITITIDPCRGQGNDRYLPLADFLQNHIIPVQKVPNCLARALVMAQSKAIIKLYI